MRKLLPSLIGFASIGFSAAAAAIPVTFDLSGGPKSSVAITNFQGGGLCAWTDCGASVTLNPGIDSLTQTLSAGQTWSFDLFSINFHGLGSGSGTLAANLGFDAPTGAPTASGNGVGDFFSGFLFTAGALHWTTQPGSFTLADGTNYSIFFDDLYGVTLGSAVNVRAKLTLIDEPDAATNVPEPSTLGIMGIGLLGLGFATRRRGRKITS